MVQARKRIAALLIIAAMFIVSFANTAQVAFAEGAGKVSLAVVGDSERQIMLCPKEIEFQSGDTALQALKNEYGAQVVVEDSSFGPYLVGIDGLMGVMDERSYWSFEVNGQPASVGAGSYELQPGDTIGFRFVPDWNVGLTTTLEQDIAQYGGCVPSPESTLVVVGDEERQVMLCPKETAFTEGQSALDLLTGEYGDQVVVEDSSFGPYLVGIDGLMGVTDERSYWSFEVNGQPASVGAGSYEVQAGDTIAFRFVADWNVGLGTTLEEDLEKFGTCSETTDPTAPPEEEEPGTTTPQPVSQNVDEAITSSMQFLLAKGFESDWEVIGAVQSGYDIPAQAKSDYLQLLQERVQTDARLFDTKLARTILAINALGSDASDFAGENLVAKLYQDEENKLANINSYVYALIALDSRAYRVPADAKWTREALIEAILNEQHTDGGWAFSGEATDPSDVDMTGMTMVALAPYQEEATVQTAAEKATVKGALEKATALLQSLQTENGGYVAWEQENTNSVAQVIMGVTAIGVDPAGSEFTKGTMNLITNLLSFQLSDGGFKWVQADTENNAFAFEQALYTLVQYKMFTEGKGSVFHFADVQSPVQDETDPVETPAPVDEQTPSTSTDDKTETGERLPDTAMFGPEDAAAAAAGVIFLFAGYVLWKRKSAA